MDVQKMQMVIFVWLSVTPLLVVPIECPRRCKCTNYKTWCYRATLNGIPSSPSNRTEFLEIRNDNITKLSRDMFQNKGLGSLTQLILVYTRTSHIEDTAFQDLIHLTDLNITHNHIEEILPGTFHNLSKLTSLVLSWNRLKTLPSRAFEGLSMIRNLDLSGNKIEKLPVDVFYGMSGTNISQLHALQISTLNLKYNHIHTVTPGTFQNMSHFTHLNLFYNKIQVLKKGSFLGLSGLRELELSRNPINYIEEGAFTGLSTLSILRMVGTKLYAITWDDNIFNDLIHLNELYIKNEYRPYEKNFNFSFQNLPIIRRKTFQNMTNLQVLNLHYNSISFIEENSFQDLHYLSDLNLGINYIDTLSESIFRGLTNLKSLDINHNDISNIEQETFKEQSFLMFVDLDFNKLTSLKEKQFYGLISLKTLRLNNNKISRIDVTAFYDLKALKVLYLRSNEISYIHNGTFRHLHRLDELYLNGNGMLTLQSGTFEGISTLRNLRLSKEIRNKNDVFGKVFQEILYISNFETEDFFENDIGAELWYKWLQFPHCTFPELQSDFLQKIIGFNHVDFSYCKISTICPGAFKHIYNNITELDLNHNKLTHLQPNMFEGLISLEDLHISYNDISVVHPNTFVRNLKLKALGLSRNERLTLPSSPLNVTSLQRLDLRGCNISYVTPLTFSGVPNLLYLDLDFNHLMTNTTQFGSVNNLKELDLSRNFLTELNKVMFEEMKSLEVLKIWKNQISVVQEDTFVENKLLRILELQGNKMLTDFPNLMNFPSIQELNLYGCNIGSFPTFSNLVRANLTKLDLSENNLTEIDFEFISSFRNLKYLYLGGNPIKCNCKVRPLIQDLERNYKQLTLSCQADRYEKQDWVIYYATLECNIMQYRNETERESTELQSIMQYVEVVILGFMFLSGVLGNVTLIFIFVLHPEVRTFANAPILNLAVADLLSLVFNLALSFTDNLSRSWELGLTLCKVFTAIRDLIVGASVYSVVSLSLQRYHATIQFNHHRAFFGLSDRVIIVILIVSVWIMAFCFAIPAFISAIVETRCLYVSSEYGEEYIQRTWTYQLLVYCVVPACIIMYFYIKTARQLKESIRNYPGEIQGTPQTQRRLRSANIVIVLTAMFCISYGPNFLLRVLTAWSVLDSRSDSMTYISFVTYCLFFFNTCFNPIALYKMSSAFRPLFRRYILFWRCCQIKTQVVENPRSRPTGPLQNCKVASPLQNLGTEIPSQLQVAFTPDVLDTTL